MTTRQGLIHFWAKCNQCEAECNARNAQAWAHNHCRKTGHRVEFQIAALVKRSDDAGA